MPGVASFVIVATQSQLRHPILHPYQHGSVAIIKKEVNLSLLVKVGIRAKR